MFTKKRIIQFLALVIIFLAADIWIYNAAAHIVNEVLRLVHR